MATREEKVLSCIDPKTQIGVEIGALTSPIVTRQMGQIHYVDHIDTEGLRAKYAADPNVDVNQIVDVDYVWGTHSLAELVGDEAPFDYAVASHVIEHVPDFIGWLKEIRAILKPGGILTLVIPDKRYCFDYYRQLTQPASVIDAYIRGARKPAPREIFDFTSSCAFWKDAHVWVGEPNEQEMRKLHTEAQAWQVASAAFTDEEYHDVHCWVFTPESFFSLLRTLINIELFDFTIAQFYETQGCEFYVSLRALEPIESSSVEQSSAISGMPQAIGVGQNPVRDHRIQLQLESLPTLPLQPLGQPQDSASLRQELEKTKYRLNQLQTEAEQLKLKLQQKQNLLKKLRDRLERGKIRLQQTQDEITAIHTSKFWKLRTQWLRLKKIVGLSGTR